MAKGRKLDEVVLQYTDDAGKKRKIRIRTTDLDAIVFSEELKKKILPLLKTEPIPPDPEEPVEERSFSATSEDGEPEDGEDGEFQSCYVINGVLICPT